MGSFKLVEKIFQFLKLFVAILAANAFLAKKLELVLLTLYFFFAEITSELSASGKDANHCKKQSYDTNEFFHCRDLLSSKDYRKQ